MKDEGKKGPSEPVYKEQALNRPKALWDESPKVSNVRVKRHDLNMSGRGQGDQRKQTAYELIASKDSR